MDFELPEEHRQIKQTVYDFCQKEVVPYVEEWEREEIFPAETIRKMGQLGFFGTLFPEEYGGTNMGALANAVVAEELARASLGVACVCNMQSVTCPLTIYRWAREDLKKKFVPKIINCEIFGCFALTEPNAASDLSAIQTRAERKGDYYIVNGTKMWITHATVMGAGVVLVKTDPTKRREGLSMLLIERDLPGLSSQKITNKLGCRCSDTGELIFEDCKVPAEYLLGEEGQGFEIAESSLAYGRMNIGARAVGIAQACLDAALKYAQEREQFGVPIGRFQMIKWLLADMVADVEAARLLVYKAAWLQDQGKPSMKAATVAKFFASEAGVRCTQAAMKIYGAYAFSEEYPVGRYHRDATLMTAGEGTSNIMRILIADMALGWRKDV